jgi:hypothetical protein
MWTLGAEVPKPANQSLETAGLGTTICQLRLTNETCSTQMYGMAGYAAKVFRRPVREMETIRNAAYSRVVTIRVPVRPARRTAAPSAVRR